MKQTLKKSLPLTGFVLLSCLIPTSANAALFTQVFIFGDSISDGGRFYKIVDGFAPVSPPYDQRFSNGIVWVEYLQRSLGFTPTLNNNFAVGGATTGNTNVVSTLLPGIEQQVGVFLGLTPSIDSDALYILFGGANDYLGGGQTDITVPVNNLSSYITDLYNAGARNFLVPNLPDLGELPETLPPNPRSNALSQITIAHNSLLASTLGTLSQTLAGSRITSPAFFSQFNDVRDRPSEYGLTNISQACLRTVEPGIPIRPIEVCSNPNEYLFWDSIHPTTRGHQIIGQFAVRALGIPEPSTTLGLLSIGLVGMGLSLARKS